MLIHYTVVTKSTENVCRWASENLATTEAVTGQLVLTITLTSICTINSLMGDEINTTVIDTMLTVTTLTRNTPCCLIPLETQLNSDALMNSLVSAFVFSKLT